jgi:enamine deaminase RidA (YjgF/YER057c/UK114 family)
MGEVENRLEQLGVTLPPAPAPSSAANFVPFVRSGNLLFLSGQVCVGPDRKIPAAFIGKLGGGVSNEDGRAAARTCAINILAQVKAAIGDLDKVARCVRMGGFVNVVPGYTGVPAIMNGASDLIVELFGERGRHARSTVGVAELPAGCAVEVEAVFEIAEG